MEECVEQESSNTRPEMSARSAWSPPAATSRPPRRGPTRRAESQLAAVIQERERLACRVKTLERDLATARKATGARSTG